MDTVITRNIVTYYDLSEEWQAEAKSNLDDLAEETMFLEPVCDYDPNKILWDLADCMPHKGNYEGFEYNAVINISNNSSMLLFIDDNFESANIMFI